VTQLHWWPHSPEEWEKRCNGLGFEERGALLHVLNQAWMYRDPVCTIADTIAEFQQLLGPRWRKLLPVIRMHFMADIERPGRLRCDWLAEIYARQSEAYNLRRKAAQVRHDKAYADRQTTERQNQEGLFPPKRRRSSSRGAPTSIARAMHDAQQDALLAQSLDSSKELRTGAAVAVAASAPAAQIGTPADSWAGPDVDSLRTWAGADPNVEQAVSARKAAAMALDNEANPRKRLTLELLEHFERDALRAVWALHHPELADAVRSPIGAIAPRISDAGASTP